MAMRFLSMGASLLLLPAAASAQGSAANPLAFVNKGVAQNAAGDHEGAIDSFNHALSISPEDPAAFEGRGEAHLAQGDLTDAIEDFNRALKDEPDDEPALFHRAAAELKNGDLAAAIADEDSALKTPLLLPGEAGAIYLLRGRTEFCRGDDGGALADANRALEPQPKLAEALFLRGAAENAKGDASAAASDFAQAAEAGMPEAALWFWLAKTEAHATDDIATQLPALLKQSFRGRPDPWISELADLLLGKATDTEIIADLPNAAGNPVKAEQGWFFLGVTREFASDPAGARQAYNHVVTLASHDSYRAAEANRRLKLLST